LHNVVNRYHVWKKMVIMTMTLDLCGVGSLDRDVCAGLPDLGRHFAVPPVPQHVLAFWYVCRHLETIFQGIRLGTVSRRRIGGEGQIGACGRIRVRPSGQGEEARVLACVWRHSWTGEAHVDLRVLTAARTGTVGCIQRCTATWAICFARHEGACTFG
jgi:hypothetical protein